MRKAFRLKANNEDLKEYENRHQPIWQELEDILIESGVITYSIFADTATGDLFAYADIEDEEKWNQISESEICKKWWAYMAPLMEVNHDNSPISIPLSEVFHIEK